MEVKRNRSRTEKNFFIQDRREKTDSVSQTDSHCKSWQRKHCRKRDWERRRKNTQKRRNGYHSFVRFMEKLAREVRRPVTMSSECRRAGSGFNVSNFGVRLVAMSARVLANQSTFAPLSSNMVAAAAATAGGFQKLQFPLLHCLTTSFARLVS